MCVNRGTYISVCVSLITILYQSVLFCFVFLTVIILIPSINQQHNCYQNHTEGGVCVEHLAFISIVFFFVLFFLTRCLLLTCCMSGTDKCETSVLLRQHPSFLNLKLCTKDFSIKSFPFNLFCIPELN